MSMLKKLLNSLKKISFIHLCDSLNLNKRVLFTCLMVTLFSGLSIVHIYMNGALVDRLIGGIDDCVNLHVCDVVPDDLDRHVKSPRFFS